MSDSARPSSPNQRDQTLLDMDFGGTINMFAGYRVTAANSKK